MVLNDENTSPKAGDVVIHKRTRSGVAYVLSGTQSPLQVSYSTYEEAVQRARAFAQRELVDAWYTDDEEVFVRVARHRNPE